MASRLHLHLRLLPSSFPSLPLLSSTPKTLAFSGTRPSMATPPLAAAARRGISTSFTADGDQFASPADLRFDSPLKIVEYPDPILRARNKRINTFDDNLRRLAHEMFDVMYKTDGIGLSAPQVGVNVQLMVFNPAGERGKGEEIVLVNPVVYKFSKRTIPYEEGCLSFPGIFAEVERPAAVKIDARDLTGMKFKVNLSGLSARVFQHEFDHLQGILFFDRMTEDILDSIRQELKNLESKYENRTGLPSPETIDNYRVRSTGGKQVAGFVGQ